MTKDNRRGVFIGIGVAAVFGVMIVVIVLASHHFARSYDHAAAACDSWRSIVQRVTDSQPPAIGDLDHMVDEANKAAAADSRYTKLWSDMREYRLFISTGVATNLNYVSSDCSHL